VRDLLAQNAIGTVKSLQSDFGFDGSKGAVRLWDPAMAGGSLLDVGVYVVALASMVFGPAAPSVIVATGEITEKGVDAQVAMSLKYGSSQLCSLGCSLVSSTPKEAVIVGTQGRITIHGPLWHTPTKFTLSVEGKEAEVFSVPIPNVKGNFNFPNSQALIYEAEEVQKCLSAHLTESPVLTLNESLTIMVTMDSIRKQIGVNYPFEKSK